MDAESRPSGNFLSMEVSNFWVYPILSEIVDYFLLKTCKLSLFPHAGDTIISPIITGYLAWGGPYIMWSVSWGTTFLHIQLSCLGVQRICALRHIVSVITSFVVGIMTVWWVPPQVAILLSILGSIFVLMIRTVRFLKNKFYQIFVASDCNLSFPPVTSESNYVWIAFRIPFFVIRIRWVWYIISTVFDCQLL